MFRITNYNVVINENESESIRIILLTAS